jgi:hypothetical protein
MDACSLHVGDNRGEARAGSFDLVSGQATRCDQLVNSAIQVGLDGSNALLLVGFEHLLVVGHFASLVEDRAALSMGINVRQKIQSVNNYLPYKKAWLKE